MPFQIINNQPSDLPFIYHLFDAAIEYQKRKNFPVWIGYDKEGLTRDIELKRSYQLAINNEIAIIFTITFEDKIVWREMDAGNAIYLHRVVVNPKYKGRRLFGNILEWVIQFAMTQNIFLIRMDTWGNNPAITQYYQSFGFEIVEYYQLPNTEDLPIQQRGNRVVLLEYKINA
jgi:ribosomal protein S18 acetylase RimI-like enzyme